MSSDPRDLHVRTHSFPTRRSSDLETEAPPVPQFATVVCDPPTAILQTGSLGAINQYDLMSMARLKTMPVGLLTLPNAHLWLWTTNAAIEERDRKSTRLKSSHQCAYRMPSTA